MLKVPDILFVNCIGSYYYTILQHLNEQSKYNELLWFLSDGKLVYQKSDIEEDYKKHGDDAWGYQPVNILDSMGEIIKIGDDFYDFLEQKIGISVKKEELEEDEKIEQRLIANLNKDMLTIINVDEFFIPTSKKSYNIKHNKHSLLVKDIDELEKKITMIDSEESQTITISFDDINTAVTKSAFNHNNIYMIETQNYKKGSFVVSLSNDEIMEKCNGDFINSMLEDLQEKMCLANSAYFFQGYYYNILSKIIPYTSMLHYLLLKNGADEANMVVDILREWRALCNFMQLKIRKKKFDFDFLERKLKHVSQKYKEAENYNRNLD